MTAETKTPEPEAETAQEAPGPQESAAASPADGNVDWARAEALGLSADRSRWGRVGDIMMADKPELAYLFSGTQPGSPAFPEWPDLTGRGTPGRHAAAGLAELPRRHPASDPYAPAAPMDPLPEPVSEEEAEPAPVAAEVSGEPAGDPDVPGDGDDADDTAGSS